MNKVFRMLNFAALIAVFAINSHGLFAQSREIDSLKKLVKIESGDTTLINNLNLLASKLINENPDTASFYSKKALAVSEKIIWKKGEALSYIILGRYEYNKGNYPVALNYFNKALDINQLPQSASERILFLANVGNTYRHLGNYAKAIDFQLKGLKISEQIGDKKRIARQNSNIGLVFKDQGNFTKALEYYQKAYSVDFAAQLKGETAIDLSNIAIVYQGQKKYTEALQNYLKALKIDSSLKDTYGITLDYANIGALYNEKGDYPKSLLYFLQALKMAKEMDNKNLIAGLLGNIGESYTHQKQYKKAEENLINALTLAKEIGYLEGTKEFSLFLSNVYQQTGQEGKALEYYKKYISVKDTLFNEQANKEITRKEMTYEFAKKETELKLKAEAEQAISKEEKKRQQFVIYGVVAVLLIVFVFSVFLFRRFKITQKQKHIIELQKNEVTRQKHMVEEHQKEIIDSITYAKRLQRAILPSDEEIKKQLPDNFIYYHPKDIVAGDFYWMEHLDNITFIAAADSTGHGVPGAMVSVVCSNALNRAVKEFGLRDTGKILDKTRELVLETFAKSGEEIKDGMDISILAIDASKQQISWSGANNPLLYISNNELKEIKADKQPIGKTDNPKPFTTHIVALQKGDIVYLMTDGYPDQFGGEKGKKFKYKQLEDLLLASSTKSLTEQKQILSKSFDDWKGNLEQVDDVTIIGIRV
jgi:tetratricopeptide (TPR) repeat protein